LTLNRQPHGLKRFEGHVTAMMEQLQQGQQQLSLLELAKHPSHSERLNPTVRREITNLLTLLLGEYVAVPGSVKRASNE
jgi:hypothetical protein